MKTILVLTDFSDEADNAAMYAVGLAMNISADIALCHTFALPERSPAAARIAWSIEDYFSLKQQSLASLSALADRITHAVRPDATRFFPKIKCISEVGDLADVVQNNIMANRDIAMIIMGMHGAGKAVQLFLGSNVLKVLELGLCPVMVVPEREDYRNPTKVIFATDLDKAHMEVLRSLSSLCTHFDAQISLVYVSNENGFHEHHSDVSQQFLTKASTNIGYPKLYYRRVKGRSVSDTLHRLSKNPSCDFFTIVYSKHGFWDRLIKGSITQKLMNKMEVPMLIYSQTMEKFPVF